MPILEMKVPSPGESILEVEIASWLVEEGDYVHQDQSIAEIDSDKATLELPAEMSGRITLKAEEGDAVEVGAVICLIDTDAKAPAEAAAPAKAAAAPTPAPVKAAAAVKAPAPTPAPTPAAAPVAATAPSHASGHPSPTAAKLMSENGMAPGAVSGTGPDGRVLAQDVVAALAKGISAPAQAASNWTGSREIRMEKMSMLRRKVSERLVAVKNETAMLTTFNEVDMKPIMDLRKKYKEAFKAHHGVGLGFMSFFTKAVTSALEVYPMVNAMIDGKQVQLHDYADIGIAV
ncbi:MAG: 2-oxo acid dehydrogenase subunit E2, partial [Myxococcota bacterium]|nr:2-oxo acid dehydrogenase subunit E2 [Myxococcota bacterium]